MDAAGHAPLVVEGDVVLDRAHVGQAERAHLLALPVLLEPAAGVPVHGQVEHEHPGDVRLGRGQLLLEFERHADAFLVVGARRRLGGAPVVACGSGLLPLGGVPRLGGLLGRAPPGLVVAVPGYGLGQAGGEVGVLRLPAELVPELGRVDRVAAVVAGAVAHPVEVVLEAAEGLEDLAEHRDVVQLAVGADEVGLADAALGQDGPDGGAVVLGVDPVADVAPVAVELGAHAVDEVRDLARDELLHVLVGAVVVGAVGDGGREAEGAGPGAHQQVGGRLGGAVGRARAVGSLLGEARRVVQRQVAVDLVGGDVVVARAVFAAGLDEGVGALDVGLQERARVGDGVVVVGLGGVVDHGVGPGHEAVDQRGVADVAHDELDAVGGQPGDVVGVAGVGELVQHGDVHAGVLAHDVVDEVGADEAAAAGDDDALGLEGGVGHGASLVVEVPVDELAGGDALEMLPVFGLAVALRAGDKRLAVDPAVLVGDLLQHGHGHVLGALDGADELAGLVEGLHGAGVQPRVAAPEGHDGEQPVLQIHAVEVGDLELAAGGGDDLPGPPAHVARVEVQAGDGVGALRVLGLLLDGDGVEGLVELHDAEALGVVDVVAEHGGEAAGLGVLHGAAEVPAQAVSVEDVVAEDERAGLPSRELLADDEGLCEAVGAGLDGVRQVHAVVRPVSQQALEVRKVRGSRDDQDVADAGHHEDGQRVVDHRLVVDRQQLLAGDGGQRIQAGAGPAGEDDTLHALPLNYSNLRSKLSETVHFHFFLKVLQERNEVIFRLIPK